MGKEFRMPPMSTTMLEARIVRWLKRPGESVQVGEALLEIESDKATVAVESPYEGTLLLAFYEEGQTVPTGAVLALIGDPEEEVQAPEARGEASEPQEEAIPSSPAARRLAKELGVDLRTVKGTGPRGRISAEDVERAAKAQARPATERVSAARAQERPEEAKALSAMRREIARAVSVSHAEIPSFWVAKRAELSEVLRLQAAVNGSVREEERLTLTDFFLQAAADVLAEFPSFCQRLVRRGEELWLEPLPAGNVGLVVALADGLLTPVLTDLTGKGLLAIARARKDVVTAARQGQLPGHSLAPAPLSLSNVGNVGIERFQALIQPGQSAIVAVGSLAEYPMVRDGSVVVGRGAELVLTVDHRLIDGVVAAQFLRRFVERMEAGSWRLL
jgi:pyruvate dehydrogenase E2 component (dihydrolipoamide acetyltransferase)